MSLSHNDWASYL